MTTAKKVHEDRNPLLEVECAWNEEMQTLKSTIKIYFPPRRPWKPHAQRPSKVKIFTPEEIAALKGAN